MNLDESAPPPTYIGTMVKTSPPPGKKNKGVCHIVALPFTFLKYLNGEEELWKLKYFTMQKL
jgi:hypothetical protein